MATLVLPPTKDGRAPRALCWTRPASPPTKDDDPAAIAYCEHGHVVPVPARRIAADGKVGKLSCPRGWEATDVQLEGWTP